MAFRRGLHGMVATVLACSWAAAHAATSVQAATQPATPPAAARKATIQASVDPRVELICILFRLADAAEYNRGRIEGYSKEVDEHFGPFRDHPAVQLAREAKRTRGVGYDAPMSLVPHLTPPPELREVVPLEPRPEGVDPRWQAEQLRQFLIQARDFARQSRFDEFFAAHKPLYEETAARMDQTMSQARLEWFDSFFGQKADAQFHLVLGLLNGPNCYGARLAGDKKVEMYCILGVWDSDGKGIPLFAKSIIPTVVHEFNHSYVNPLVHQRSGQFEAAGKKIFAGVEQTMRRQAYGNWETMILESLVRACVVRYRYANEGALAGGAEIIEQNLRGFAWTGELSQLLAEYEQNREKYPTLESFMPRIVTFFEDYASRTSRESR